MARFPPIDPYLITETPHRLGRSKYRNVSRRSICYYLAMNSICQPEEFANTWGYTVFRTDYSSPKSDDNFATAVKRLNAYAGNWLFDDLRLDQYRMSSRPPLDPRSRTRSEVVY